jgi:ribosomal protein S19E (S16A)
VKFPETIRVKDYITEEINARVIESRNHYGKELDAGYKVPPALAGCDAITNQILSIWNRKGCATKRNMSRDVSQNVRDMIEVNDDAKDVIEAYASCQAAHQAGQLLRGFNLLDLYHTETAI